MSLRANKFLILWALKKPAGPGHGAHRGPVPGEAAFPKPSGAGREGSELAGQLLWPHEPSGVILTCCGGEQWCCAQRG